MATRSYTIHSVYEADEKEHEALVEQAEHQAAEEADEDWQYDKSFGPRKPPPRFVPAQHPDGKQIPSKPSFVSSSTSQNPSSLEWYRSIRSSASSNPNTEGPILTEPIAGSSKLPGPTLVQPTPKLAASSSVQTGTRPVERKSKNNWFIMNAIESQPQARTEPSTPAPNLAAILARDPPPLPSEKQYKPPVWLEIGPSNKGFAMLQRSGWNEGEPLGPEVIRRPNSLPSPEFMSFGDSLSEPRVKRERREVQLGSVEDGVSELREVDVIDLTEEDEVPASNEGTPGPQDDSPPPDHLHDVGEGSGRTALITPIATVLKSDRLGIGLKAKTEGPYKASMKRITHNRMAVAAHIRRAAEQKRRIQEVGRGRRGFQRQYQKAAERTQNLLAYLNG